MNGFGGTGGGIIILADDDAGPEGGQPTANDIVDKDMFLGVEDKCPNLARAATSKAETADFKEVFDEVSKYNKQPDC